MKLLLLFIFLTTQSLFALVSIVPVEVGKKVGVSGSIEAGLETKRGNTEKDNYYASLRVSYDNNKTVALWAEVSADYGKSSGIEDTNKAFAHLRYIHTITDDKKLIYELFTQLEDDKFRQINGRFLYGGGLRYKVLNTPSRGVAFLGLGAFSEDITYTDSLLDPDEKNVRLSSYISYSLDFGEDSSFSYSLYYQPKFSDFSDYVNTNKLELKVQVYKELFLKLSASWNVDSNPPVGVEDKDFSQRTTFVLNF